MTIPANAYSATATFMPPSEAMDEVIQINAILAGKVYGGVAAVVQPSEVAGIQGLTARGCPHGVDIKWSGLPSVCGAQYSIYRSTSAQPDIWVKLNSTIRRGTLSVSVPIQRAEFLDTTALPGSTYNYQVQMGAMTQVSGKVTATVPTGGANTKWITSPTVTGTTVTGTISYPTAGQFLSKIFCNGYLVGTISQNDVNDTNSNYGSFNFALDRLAFLYGSDPVSFTVLSELNGALYTSPAQSVVLTPSPWRISRNDDILETQKGELAFCEVTYYGATSWTYAITNSAGMSVYSVTGTGQSAYAAWNGGTCPSESYLATVTFQTPTGPKSRSWNIFLAKGSPQFLGPISGVKCDDPSILTEFDH